MYKKMFLFTLLIWASTSFAITKEVLNNDAFNCKSSELNNLIIQKLSPYTTGNRKHVDLTYCNMYFSGDIPLIKMRIYTLSKDQAKVKLGFIKITKTLYEYGATLDVTFKINPETCVASLDDSFVDYHSEGAMSLPFRGALRLTRGAVNKLVKEQINKFLAKKKGPITQYCY